MSDNNSEVRPENETTEAPPAKKIRFAKTKKFYRDYKPEFNALGVELGQRYRSGAVVDDGTVEAAPSRDPELHYTPTTRPGGMITPLSIS